MNLCVIVNGITGAMGREIAKSCAARGVELANFALRSSSSNNNSGAPASVEIEGKNFALCDALEFETKVAELKRKYASVIAIDFTHPSVMNANAELYNKLLLPFVMGTTGGGSEDELAAGVERSKNFAVIAPNMGKQVVAFQAMFEYMASNFPGSFSGYAVTVTESHQSTKADTSGTAKAVCTSLSELVSKPVEEESIRKLRADEESKAFGVDEAYLLGHAHHTYKLTSGDKTVVFEFKHNVNGRTTYAEGVVDAVQFLHTKLQQQQQQKVAGKRIRMQKQQHVFDMVDVLKEGKMS